MWYLSMTGRDQSETFSGTTRKKSSEKKLCKRNDERWDLMLSWNNYHYLNNTPLFSCLVCRFKFIPFSSDPALRLKKVALSQAEAVSLFDRYELLCPAKPKVSNSNSSSGADSLNHQPPQSMNLRKRYPRMPLLFQQSWPEGANDHHCYWSVFIHINHHHYYFIFIFQLITNSFFLL